MKKRPRRPKQGIFQRFLFHYRADLVFLFFFIILSSFSSVFAEPVSYDSGNRRDPMIPLIGPGSAPKFSGPAAIDLKVEGIVYEPPDGSLVLVSGEFLKPGEKIGESIIKEIFKDHIVLLEDNEEKMIWLRDESEPSQGEVSE